VSELSIHDVISVHRNTRKSENCEWTTLTILFKPTYEDIKSKFNITLFHQKGQPITYTVEGPETNETNETNETVDPQ
jgi:hypothetical protein